jgi:protoporphyrinogen oxidase
MVFKTALLGRAGAADIGVPAVPLGELHGTAARAAIKARGGTVCLATKVTAIEPGPTIVVDGTRIDASAVIVATPHRQAATLVPLDAAPGRDRWRDLDASPIVNVHVVYDRRVTGLPFAAAVDSPVQWVFDRTKPSGLSEGQYLAISLSGAADIVDEPVERLRERFLPALARLFPSARTAAVRQFLVTRERAATFRQGPGSGSWRLPPETLVPRLFVAGAWTDTGWPATMEGAVRSGLAAARKALITLGRTERLPVEVAA